MRTAIVMDSVCDLPNDYVRKQGIEIMPSLVYLETRTLTDERSELMRKRFLDENLVAYSRLAHSTPWPVARMRQFLIERVVPDHDQAVHITFTAHRSEIFARANEVARSFVESPVTTPRGVPFRLDVIDSHNMFAGHAVTVCEAVRLRDAEWPHDRLLARLQAVAGTTYGYMVPSDLQQLRARAQVRGDRSIGWFPALVGSALGIKPVLTCYRGSTRTAARVRGFDHACARLLAHVADRVRAGVMTPIVCLSFGGDAERISRFGGYAALREVCAAKGVEVLEAPMSITAMLNMGSGALTVGFATVPYAFALP